MKALKKWTRRGFVGAAGATALTVPFWKILRGEAQPSEAPKRLLVVFSPNGTFPGEYFPDDTGRGFRLKRILSSLEPFREKLLILQGIDQQISYTGPGDGHQKGMGCLWTGVELLPGDTMGGCDSCPPVSWASSMSIDQAVAMQIGADTPFPSVELGVDVGRAENVWSRMVYRSAGEPLPPEDDPWQAFDRLFGDLGEDATGVERRRALRRSVLDFARQDFERVRPRLGSEDRQKLDSHLESVRELERRLESSPAVGAACAIPELGSPVGDLRSADNYPVLVDHMSELVTMAFACDLTRVASLQWNRSVGQMSFPHLGFTDRHHDLSHEGDSNGAAQEKIIQINTWYAEQFASLLARLESIPEGDDTLLDNTLVVWGNELGKGNSHTRRNMPFLLAGGGGGFEMGRHLRFDGASHNDLLTSIVQAFGVETDCFGDRRFCSGPLI